ncbi:MAG: hypothetical protein D6748_00160 [Calditrichaeota bacterium]|nr:MAG: hypothetical protein D6748_00160 [Calditrichota bacterium]
MKRVFTVLCIVLLSMALSAQYYQHQPGMGGINWTDQVVRATGYGAPNPNLPPGAQRASAIEAAKTVALRNLLQMVKGMYINSETTVENAMVTSDVIHTQVEGIVRNFRIVDTRYMSTGDIEVDVEVPLSSFYEILSQIPGGLPPQGQQPSGYPSPGTPQPGAGNVYTGLIVDATGLGLRPALAPKILDEMGNEVYGTGYVSRDYAVQIGVVGYEKDLNRAQMNDRVKGNPLVIKALRATGKNKTDVVISNQDAQLIRNAAANLNFLEQCKVMFILD